MTDTLKTRRRFPKVVALLGLLACLPVAFIAWRAAADYQRDRFLENLSAGSPTPAIDDPSLKIRIERFCGDCHAVPLPQNFPRDQWHHEVRAGYEYYARSGRQDLDPPPIQSTLAYFRSQAPPQVVFPETPTAPQKLAASFTTEKLDWNGSSYVLPAVSYLRWMRAPWANRPMLFICDMRDGSISTLDLSDPGGQRRVLGKMDHPCHIEPCDLDGNGSTDFVVPDLGSMYADDLDRGRVVWLRYDAAADTYTEVVLAAKLGRVADVRPADVDGDGDQDLIVAEFGHETTGKIMLLLNVAARGEAPRFEQRVLDVRPGTIHVPTADLNGDGRIDFVALISQEYEGVDLFLNQGDARFHIQRLWAGPDLSFGSSGIDLVDLDRDQDLDILLSNGDVFDNSFANPSHGVQWLENLGDLRFEYHRLTDLPGAYRALAGDIDRDGDLDVVAVSFLRSQVLPASLRSPSTVSIVCLEQTAPGKFVRHVLESGLPYHAALELGDFDQDGDLDLVVGAFAFPADSRAPPRLTVWWNQLVPSPNKGR